MRIHDQALPAVTLDPLDPAGGPASWPFRPVIALANNAGVFVDLTCYWSSLFIETGPVDKNGNAPVTRTLVTLVDPDRELARYTADLRLTDWAVGNELVIYATDGVWTHPLFRGRLARFDDIGNDRLELEGYDAIRDLAAEIPTPYTAGVTGDSPGTRIAAILALTLVSVPTYLEAGSVALTAQPSEELPIDEMRIAAQSDGGVVFVDVDGTLRYFNRAWRGGRTDQPSVPSLSDDVCDVGIRAWDVEYTTNDTGQADMVRLTNVAGLVAAAQRATPPALRNRWTGQTVEQWATQIDGDQLAAFLLRTAPAAGELAARGAQLYALDLLQPALAELAVSIRLFDRVTVTRAQPVAPLLLEVPAVVLGVRHEASPATGWLTSIVTARAVPYLKADLWDDTPIKLWNDTPLRYWSY